MTGREEVSETFSRPLSQKNKKMEMKLKRLYFIVCCSLLAGAWRLRVEMTKWKFRLP